jgi:NRPS condensation-like uncharacterized protein
MRRTPLNLLDEQFLPWDRVVPLTFLCELRVSGHLDADRVADALRVAISRHPMARARLGRRTWRNRGQHWEIVDGIEDIPLQVVACDDDRALDEARARLRQRRMNLRTAPPLALMLAHRAGGDSLCMSLSHVVVDGVSAYRLMRSVACAYAGVEDPIAGPDPLVVHDLSFYNGGFSALGRLKQLRRMRGSPNGSDEKPAGAPATLANDDSSCETSFRDFHFLHLDRAQTAAAYARRHAPATFNDLLIGSLGVAVRRWNDAHGVKSGTLEVQMPLNLRPAEWPIDVVANLVADVHIGIPEPAQKDLVSAQLAVAEQTRNAKTRRERAELATVTVFNVIPTVLRYPLAKLLLRRSSYPTTLALSNLGPTEFPNLGPDAGPVSEFWLNPSRGSGSGTIAAALGLRGETFVVLHRKLELDKGGASHFADLWREVLLGGG